MLCVRHRARLKPAIEYIGNTFHRRSISINKFYLINVRSMEIELVVLVVRKWNKGHLSYFCILDIVNICFNNRAERFRRCTIRSGLKHLENTIMGDNKNPLPLISSLYLREDSTCSLLYVSPRLSAHGVHHEAILSRTKECLILVDLFALKFAEVHLTESLITHELVPSKSKGLGNTLCCLSRALKW